MDKDINSFYGRNLLLETSHKYNMILSNRGGGVTYWQLLRCYEALKRGDKVVILRKNKVQGAKEWVEEVQVNLTQ